MESNVLVVGGLFDNLLKSLVQWPDFAKADHEKLKQGVGLCVDSLKPTTNSLGGMLLDAVKQALSNVIDAWKQSGPLVVGATPEMVMEHAISVARKRSRKEVEDMIRNEGGDPTQFAPWILLLLQLLPVAFDVIKMIRDLCYDCGGIGTITNDMDEDITCPMCDGSGVEPLEPFEEVF